MLSLFPIYSGGRSCYFDEDFSVTGNGVFTFDYAYPYLYLTDEGASYDSILKIYDVSIASAPVLVSTTALPAGSGAQQPRIYGDLLYIPYTETRYLAIWNVANRASPSLLSATSLPDSAGATPSGPQSVAVIGSYACVMYGLGFTMTTTMQKLDISDPSSPTIVDSLKPYNPGIVSSGTSVIAAGGNFVATGMVTGGSSTPYVVTVDPSTFDVLDIVTFGSAGGSTSEIVSDATGDYVYVYNGSLNELYTIDISDPSNISASSGLTVVGTAATASISPLCIANNDRLYLGKKSGGGLAIWIFDISTPGTPSQSGSLSTSSDTVSCMRQIDGCFGFAWGQGNGASIHLLGTAPLS